MPPVQAFCIRPHNGLSLVRVSLGLFLFLEANLTTSKLLTLPEDVLNAVSAGVHIARAYREYLGYTVHDMAVTSGLTVKEVERIEGGHRFDKGYRERIAKALSLPAGVFEIEPDIADAA
jgi:hypothetical protein